MKKSFLRITAFLIVLALSASCLAACSSDAPVSQSSADSKTEVSQTNVEESLSGTVNVILSDETLLQNYQKVLTDFMDRNPDLNINFERALVTEIDSKINLAHASGQDYDLIHVNNSSVNQFHAAGILEPLDNYLKNSGIDLTENYSDALLSVGSVDGAQYAIPQTPDCRVMAYNKNLMDKFNLSLPTNQDELLAAAKAVTGDGVYGYVRQMNSLSAVYNEGNFMLSNGAAICREENGKIVGSCNTSEMIDAVQFWVDMAPYMPQDMNYNDDQVRSMFGQGKVLFYVFGPWEINRVDSEICENMVYGEDYGLIPIPGFLPASIAGGFYVGIGSGSKNKEATWAIMEELLIPDSICGLGVTLPADQRCYDMPPFNEEIYQPFKDAFEGATPPMPYSENFNKICDIFYEYFNRAVIGGEDIGAMMEACDAEINKLFAE